MEKERKRESVGGPPALSQGGPFGGQHYWPSLLYHAGPPAPRYALLFVLFCFGRIPLVSRDLEKLGSCLAAVPAWEHSSQRWLLSSSPLGR